MNKFAALWAPVLGGIVMTVMTAFINANNGDNLVTASEWVQISIQGFSVFVVWGTANLNTWPKMKGWAMAAMAILNVLVTVIDGGVTFLEIMNLVVAGLSAAGVFATAGPVTATAKRV